MIDLFTYLIYISLLIILMVVTSYQQTTTSNKLDFSIPTSLNIQHVVALLIIALIVGFRYEVGVDWEGYKDRFQEIVNNPSLKYSDQYMEIGFFYINQIIAKLGLSYEWMFFTMALITWYFIFKSVPGFLLPLLIFFLFVDEYFFWGMNGVRQFAAIGIWLFSVKYIITKDFIKYFTLILLGSIFHKSMLLLLPLYFVPYNKISNVYYWLVLFVLSLIIGTSGTFLNIVKSITIWLGERFEVIGQYTRYIGTNKLFMNEALDTGLGFLFKVAVNFVIIIISGKIIVQYPRTSIFFVFFFIGAIIFNLSYNIQLVGRLNNYFLIMRSIVLAIITWHYFQIPRYRHLALIFCSLYFILFLRAIYISSNMCSPYMFSWTITH